PVPLSALADLTTDRVPASIIREDGVRRIAIGADARGGALSGAVDALHARLAGLALPPGYRVDLGGEAAARAAAPRRLPIPGCAVLIAVLVLLAAAFRSFADAALVLVNIPLGLVGGVAGAAISPDGLSVAGFVGFVTLFGIITRNGVMLVTHH